MQTDLIIERLQSDGKGAGSGVHGVGFDPLFWLMKSACCTGVHSMPFTASRTAEFPQKSSDRLPSCLVAGAGVGPPIGRVTRTRGAMDRTQNLCGCQGGIRGEVPPFLASDPPVTRVPPPPPSQAGMGWTAWPAVALGPTALVLVGLLVLLLRPPIPPVSRRRAERGGALTGAGTPQKHSVLLLLTCLSSLWHMGQCLAFFCLSVVFVTTSLCQCELYSNIDALLLASGKLRRCGAVPSHFVAHGAVSSSLP